MQGSTGHLLPASPHLRSEVAIVTGLAKALLPQSGVPWDDLARDYSQIRAAIGEVIPAFAGYNENVARPGGFYLPNPVRQGVFPTASGNAHFTVHAITTGKLGLGRRLLMTLHSHYQINTTLYGRCCA